MFADRIVKEKEDAKIKGRAEGRVELILNLYREGVELEFIAKVSGYSLDKIREIVKK